MIVVRALESNGVPDSPTHVLGLRRDNESTQWDLRDMGPWVGNCPYMQRQESVRDSPRNGC